MLGETGETGEGGGGGEGGRGEEGRRLGAGGHWERGRVGGGVIVATSISLLEKRK